MGRMFQSEGESISSWECRVVEPARYCEYGDFEDQACRDRFIHYFPIVHNALCLPPKFCINYCFEILLGGLHIPKSIPQQ